MSCQKCGSTDTYCGCDEATAIAERDAALAELAALKKRIADAERVDYYFPSRFPGPSHMTCAVVPLMEGEA